jgi:hypothetical protein
MFSDLLTILLLIVLIDSLLAHTNKCLLLKSLAIVSFFKHNVLLVLPHNINVIEAHNFVKKYDTQQKISLKGNVIPFPFKTPFENK